MSSLWTPGGERPVPRDPPAGEPGRPGGSADPESRGSRQPTPEEMQAQMAELQEQLARTPAHLVVANHAFGLFELAALHLSLQPPQLDEARVAIDAMAALVEGLGERLGEHARELGDGLAQLRLAYVQIQGARRGGNGAKGDSGSSDTPDGTPPGGG